MLRRVPQGTRHQTRAQCACLSLVLVLSWQPAARAQLDLPPSAPGDLPPGSSSAALPPSDPLRAPPLFAPPLPEIAVQEPSYQGDTSPTLGPSTCVVSQDCGAASFCANEYRCVQCAHCCRGTIPSNDGSCANCICDNCGPGCSLEDFNSAVVDNYFFPHICEGSDEINECSFDNLDMKNLVTYYTALNTSIVDFLANYTTNATALIESEYFDLLTNGTNITRADAYFFYNNTAKSIIASFDLDNSSGLNLTEFTNMLEYDLSQLDYSCLASDGYSRLMSPPDCPCIPIKNFQIGVCYAGYVCSTDWDEPEAQPVCRPCQLGQYCEEGSGMLELDLWVLEEKKARTDQDNIEFLCEEGMYCPIPNVEIECPEGHFCDQGSRDPKTCELYNMDPETPILGSMEKLIDKIQRGRPLGGNYCAPGSKQPMNSCKAGYYCPTPGKRIECPSGYFCKEYSVTPKKCSLWASCPKGSKSPGFKNLELSLTLVFILICVLLCKVALRFQERARRNQTKRIFFQSKKLAMVENVLKSLVSGLPLTSPSRLDDAELQGTRFQGFRTVSNPVAIVFDSLGLKLTNGKVVLQGVTGLFQQAHLIAIMGPSGCGKSTFLNVLSSKATYGMMTGEVEVVEVTSNTDLDAIARRMSVKNIKTQLTEEPSPNDSQSTHSVGSASLRASPSRASSRRRGGVKKPLGLKAIRLDMGYVPQDDTVHDELTVIENLRFSAFMRLGRDVKYKTLMSLVYDTINVLQLAHVATSIVGSVEKRGISGGQRKRVNIGTELVAFPRVIFLDEPTSGLDATASSAILSGLQRICNLGVMMAMVIHQPRYDIFTLFDSVLLLGPGGRTVYLGPSTQALEYFTANGFTLPENANPADFFLDVISGQESRADAAGVRSNPTAAELFGLWEAQRDSFFATHAVRYKAKFARSPAVQPLLRGDLEKMYGRIPKSEAGEVTFAAFREFMSTGLAGHLSESEESFHTEKELKRLFMEIDQGHSHSITQNEFVTFFLGSVETSSAGKMVRMVSRGKVQDSPETDAHDAGEVRQSPATEEDAGEVDSSQLRVDIIEEAGEPVRFTSASHVETRTKQSIWLLSVKLLERELIKWLRNVGGHTVDLTLVLVSATIIGLVTGSQWEPRNALSNAVLSMLTLGVLATVASLRVFGKSRVVFWRESAAGISVFSRYLATVLVDLIDITLRPFFFVLVYRSFIYPSITFTDFFLVGWAVSFMCSGMGYALSAFMHPNNSLVAGVCVAMILGGFFNGVDPSIASYKEDNPAMVVACGMSFNRWAVEAIVIKEYDKYPVHLMPLTAGIIAVTYGYMPVDLNNLRIVYENVTRILEAPDSEDFEGYNLTAARREYDLEGLNMTGGFEENQELLWERIKEEIVFDEGRHFEGNILGLFAGGLLLRIIAYLGFKYYNKDKQA